MINFELITNSTYEKEVHDMMKMGVRAPTEEARASMNKDVTVKKRILIVLKLVAIAAVSLLLTLIAWQMK